MRHFGGNWGFPVRVRRSMLRGIGSSGLNKIQESGVRRRAELFYQHLDALQVVRRQVRGEFLAEKSEPCGGHGAASDSLYRTGSIRPVAGTDADAAPIP